VGEQATDYEELAKLEHLSGESLERLVGSKSDQFALLLVVVVMIAIEIEIRKLNDKVKMIRSEQNYQRAREEEFRDSSESINSRVLWSSILQSVLLVAVAIWQATRLKSFFKQIKVA